jgi:hypothetical protein
MTECPLLEIIDTMGVKAEVCHVTGTLCLPALTGASSRHCTRKAWYLDQERHTRNTLRVLQSGPDQGGIVPVKAPGATGQISQPSKPD